MRIPLRLCLLLAVLLAAPSTAQGSLWIVDDQGGPGTDFSLVQPAIDAAQPGDTVLVRSSAAGGFVIDGKGITVVSEVVSGGSCEVRNVPAGETVLVRGLIGFDWGSMPLPVLVKVEDSAGEVWFEDCAWSSSKAVVHVEDSQSVTFVRCAIVGFDFYEYWNRPLRVLTSNVRMFDSRVAVQGTPPIYLPGSDAVTLNGGSLWLDGCWVTGGPGRDETGKLGPFPTKGGAGVYVSGGAQLSTRDCVLEGGAGGGGWWPAADGPPVKLAGGTHIQLSGSARSVALPVGVLVAGKPAAITATAPAGELVLLLVGFDVNPRPVLGLPDALLPANPMFFVHAGTVPSGGELSLPISPPDLGPVFPALNLFVQGLFLTATPAWVLGQASASSLVSLP